MKQINQLLDNLNPAFYETKKKQKTNRNITTESKSELVIQHNHLIEAHYRLSLQEKRVILWLLTQIKPNDEDFKLHKLEVREFSNMTGLEAGNQYSKLQEITLNLMKRVMKIYEPYTKSILQMAWLSFAKYHLTKGYIELRFDPALKPYLLKLKSQFTKLTLSDIMQLSSIYAIRVYELLKQYEYISQRKISIKDLYEYCGIAGEEYKKYNNFKSRILERAKKEINAKTDIVIDYIEIKESRKIVAIEWTIKKKNIETEERLKKLAILEKELRSERIIIDDLMEYGFGKTIAKRLVTQHGEDVIRNAIRAVNLQIERGKAKNPKAMLQTAIQEKWHPEKFKSKKRVFDE